MTYETEQPLEGQPPAENSQQQPGTEQEQDFEAAFNEFAVSESASGEDDDPPADPPPGEQDTPGEDDPKDPNNPEEPGNPPEDVNERLKALEAENRQLKHSEASQRGRLGAYQRKINELESSVQELRQNPSTGQAPGSDDQQRQAMAEEAGMEDWEAFQKDFPDIAKAFEARLEADRRERGDLERQLKELQSAVEPIQQQARDQELAAEVDALEARHPGWQDMVNAPEFREWFGQQPESLQQLAESEDAAESAALLDLYKAQTKKADPPAETTPPPEDRRQDRLAAAQTVSRRGSAPRGGAPEDFDAAFDYYATKRAAR